MSKKAQKCARKLARELKAMKVSSKQVTDLLNCGDSLISMYCPAGGRREASKVTEYILTWLCAPGNLRRLLNSRLKAMSRYPSAESVVSAVGLDRVVEITGLTKLTVKRWKKKYPDLWTPLSKPRVAIAMLRLLALDYAYNPELEEDLFSQAEKNSNCCKAGTQVSTPSGVVSVEELKAGDSVIVGDGTQARVAGVPIGTQELVAELRQLADLIEVVDLDIVDLRKIQDLTSGIRNAAKEALAVRKEKIEKELALLDALGV